MGVKEIPLLGTNFVLDSGVNSLYMEQIMIGTHNGSLTIIKPRREKTGFLHM